MYRQEVSRDYKVVEKLIEQAFIIVIHRYRGSISAMFKEEPF